MFLCFVASLSPAVFPTAREIFRHKAVFLIKLGFLLYLSIDHVILKCTYKAVCCDTV